MKNIHNYITERLKLSNKASYKYYPKTKYELEELVYKLIKELGNDADLNDIDTSKITDMIGLFKGSDFNGNISQWDVSNVVDMNRMFFRSDFNGDISQWDVSNVIYMNHMFFDSKFNGDISDWNVSNVEDMYCMFKKSPLEKNPPKWYKK